MRKAAAKQYEEEHGVAERRRRRPDRLYRPAALRAYRLENAAWAGKTIASFRRSNPEYRIVNVVRGGESLGADRRSRPAGGRRRRARRPARGADRQDGADRARRSPTARRSTSRSTRPRSWSPTRRCVKRTLRGVARHCRGAGQMQVVEHRARRRADPGRPRHQAAALGHDVRRRPQERGPARLARVRPGRAAEHGDRPADALARHDPRLPDRRDRVSGLRRGSASATPAACCSRASSSRRSSRACASSATRRTRRATSWRISGSSSSSAIVGINAGNSLLAQLTGAIALKIFLVGFIACTIPPFVVWAIGYPHLQDQPGGADGRRRGRPLPLRPLPRGRRGDREHVPWIGFPVGYAVSGVLLTVFGYFASKTHHWVDAREHTHSDRSSARPERRDRVRAARGGGAR